MRTLQHALASAWNTLNPAEPSPKYLATFMAVAAALFAGGYLIGHA